MLLSPYLKQAGVFGLFLQKQLKNTKSALIPAEAGITYYSSWSV